MFTKEGYSLAFTDIFKTKEMKNKIAALEKENSNLKESKTSLEKENTQLNSSMDILKEQFAEINENKISLEKENVQLNSSMDSLKNDKALLESEIKDLKNLLTPQHKDAKNISDEICKLKEDQNILINDINDKKESIQNLSNKLDELQGIMSRIDYMKNLEKKIQTCNSIICDKQKTIECLETQVEGLKKEIIVDNEVIELESFALYEPRYKFTHSDHYKNKLEIIRNKQKEMIKEGKAACGSQNWTVNESRSQGNKMIKDNVKLCLRSFNNECDAAVSSVKFNNFEKCVQRIQKSAESIDKLSSILEIKISPLYKQLKFDELTLAFEYEIKKQQEKEELRELRIQQREEAKVVKELEEARKKIEKDQKHYENALTQLESKIENHKSEEELKDLMDKKTELISQMEEVKNKLKDIDYREANQKAGYVYIISNIGSFGEDIYKIGMTRRLDPYERIYELSDASVPFNFDVHAMIFCEDAPKLEAILHKTFEPRKLNMINTRREFFKVSLDEIKKVIKENYDKTVEFIDVPEAPQYRESLKIKQGLQS